MLNDNYYFWYNGNITSQQAGSNGVSVWSLHVLPMAVWVLWFPHTVQWHQIRPSDCSHLSIHVNISPEAVISPIYWIVWWKCWKSFDLENLRSIKVILFLCANILLIHFIQFSASKYGAGMKIKKKEHQALSVILLLWQQLQRNRL